MSDRQLPNDVVLSGIVDTILSQPTKLAIIECARNDLGEQRDIRRIVAIARRRGADPAVVAAAFGFLQRPDGHYADVLRDNSDDPPEALGALPRRNPQLSAAFALSRAVCPEVGSFVTE